MLHVVDSQRSTLIAHCRIHRNAHTVTMHILFSKFFSHREQDGQLSTSLLREDIQALQRHYSRQELMLTSKTRFVNNL